MFQKFTLALNFKTFFPIPAAASASPTSIIGYSTSSSNISVQSSRETDSLQLETLFTTKEDVASSSTNFVTGKNNFLAFTLLD